MLIWVASYPRSGNSLLRSILKQAFGRNTFSLYNDPKDFGASKERSRLIGHITYPMSWDRFYCIAKKKDKLYFVKTHGEPLDEAPAIYVVRDGRASIVSYYHYIETFGKTSVDLTDVVLGRVTFGSWSEHFDLWRPDKRKSTLLLKYEDLVAEPEAAVKKIAEFSGLQIVGKYQNKFAEHKKAFPEFFRSGSNRDNIEELSREAKELFDLLHSGVMARLGYSRKSRRTHRVARRILLAQRDTIVELQAENKKTGVRLAQVETDFDTLKKELTELSAKSKQLRTELHQTIVSLEETVTAREQTIIAKGKALAEKTAIINEREKTIQAQIQAHQQRVGALQEEAKALEESLRSLLRSRWRRLGVALRLSKRHQTPFGEM